MTEILGKVLPLLFLIALGYILQRMQFLGEEAFFKLQSLVLNIALPCMLCITFINLDVDVSYAWLSVAFFSLMVILLVLGFVIYRIFPIKRSFFPFLLTSFGFGTTSIPFYVALFGQENLKYLSVLGVGHEVFIALVFLPLAQMCLSGEKITPYQLLRSLKNPFLVMTFMGLIIRVFGLRELLFNNALGLGLYGAIERLGAISLTLTLVIIGYRLQLSNRKNLVESVLYVVVRYAVSLSVAFAFKLIIIDNLIAPNPLFDAAYFILLTQHSSISLTVLVGQNCAREDHEVVTNTFVINTVVGILIFLVYSLTF
ncbi:AEC family transporter [Oscillospiraceae bacterium LTW-04]|nr:hypothetical protein RBH76_04030 [Oscillospiraceae bacterium MB24-C1]